MPVLTLLESFWVLSEGFYHWSRPWDGLSETISSLKQTESTDRPQPVKLKSMLSSELWLLHRTGLYWAKFLSAGLKLHCLSLAFLNVWENWPPQQVILWTVLFMSSFVCLFVFKSKDTCTDKGTCRSTCVQCIWISIKQHLNNIPYLLYLNRDIFVDLRETWVQNTQKPKLHSNQP